ncbi:unnamed protein product [Acanthoscelides obtectus]|uniref:Uncharacterized protein n=1 Tax=Acanthoscelides obtectus TaxID=200917 RepID=A0A9P0M8E5_ACAOB|nr:unnamed protein product [Acanthoscelides obtectus]CAK1672221.1 Sideroflexin-3 [Acanthoscelides obtectus]
MSCYEGEKINLDEPRYDQDTYIGRARHFFEITNPLNLFVSYRQLEEARCLVTKYNLLSSSI